MSTNRGDARGLARRREDPDPARAHPRAQRYPLVGTELDPDGDQVWFRIPIAGPLLSSTTTSVIAQAIPDRQSEIDRLQAEIKALTDVEQIQSCGCRGYRDGRFSTELFARYQRSRPVLDGTSCCGCCPETQDTRPGFTRT